MKYSFFVSVIGKKAMLPAMFIAALCFIFLPEAGATRYYSKASTNFSLVSTWTADTALNTNASPLTSADTFIVRNGFTVTLNANFSVGMVVVRSGGIFTLNGTRTLTTSSPLTIDVGGTLNLDIRNMSFVGDCINNGTITGSSGQLSINAGNFTNNGSFTVTTGTPPAC